MKTLKDVREARGVTQVAVARHLGIARQTYASYEDRPGDLSYNQLQAVCDFLHCPISDIFLAEEVK